MRSARALSLHAGPLTFTRFTPPRAGWIALSFAFTFWATANLLRLAWWAVIWAAVGSIALGAAITGAVSAWQERR